MLGKMNCNLCVGSDLKILFHSGEYPDGQRGNIFQCRGCGLIFRDPYPRINSFSGQQTHQTRRPDKPDKLSEGRITLFNSYMRSITHFRFYNRLLDVGSGEGYFLKLCSIDGWDVWGVEEVSELAEFTKKEYGISVFNGTLEGAKYPDNFFDIVVFLNVLEHLVDPYSALSETFRILRPGGGILFRFPNPAFHITSRWLFTKLYRLWKGIRRFDHSVIHLYSFNRTTIHNYLTKAGFRSTTFQNTSIACSSITTQGNSIKRLLIHVVEGFIELIKIISGGRFLIGSSLTVLAVKPLR